MLTNLAYGGGGDNTFGDAKTITANSTIDLTQPYYIIPPNSNKTTGTTNPSTSTDGGVTNPQYGYYYNWCAAMGGQTSTSACADAVAPLPDANISVCPAGWRLPTGAGGEFRDLNNAINGGSTTDPSGLLSIWLGQYGGGWYGGFNSIGTYAQFSSSTQSASSRIYGIYFYTSFVYDTTSSVATANKASRFPIRCLAS